MPSLCEGPSPSTARPLRRRSQLVAVRDIAAGDEITQAYMQPFGRSELRRRTAFHEQHLTQLTPSPYPPEMDALAPGQPTPQQATWQHVVGQVGDLEDALEELEGTWEVCRALPCFLMRLQI